MQRKNDIGFAVRRLSNAIKRDIEKSKLKMQIDSAKSINGWALNYFYENRDRDIFQRDFEQKFSIRRSTASKMLKSMEQNGFIERVSVESDARLKKIVLTDKAIEQHKRILEDIERREKILRKGLTETEVKQFLNILQIITANMEEEND
ncbi:MAG: MarR family transcriptional regulator [Clostridia bacterium]|nr:MarR family transcriptional regulator [Clostridia bacterium]